MYGKNRRYFKTLATAVNTCRRENTEHNISYLFMCIHFGVGYRRYYTPWCTHMQCVISRKSHGCPNQRFIFIAHRLQSAGINRNRLRDNSYDIYLHDIIIIYHLPTIDVNLHNILILNIIVVIPETCVKRNLYTVGRGKFDTTLEIN